MAEASMWKRPFKALAGYPRLLATGILSIVALGALAAGLAYGAWRTICHDCPSIAQIYVWEPKQSTKVLSHDGQLIAELFQERRTWVSLNELPAYVPQAFLAVEDRRFYQHNGFDPRGVARAVWNQLRRRPGGGSTITQQVARNMFQEQVGFEVNIRRKLRELHVALELEQVYTKDQILEAYINQVNYGPGWWGIETAAQRFFGKTASQLDVPEAALLAAVINLPTFYNPFRNPERALGRRNLVLSLMAEQGFIDRRDAEAWKQTPLPEEPHTAYESQLAPYFVEWVRDVLNERYGMDLYRRGFRIYTTLDVEMQRRAQAAMERGWERIESQPGFRHPKYADVKARNESAGTRTPYVQGAFIAYDLGSGEIRALVGGRDFGDSRFNRAIQARRQPGSVFKTFVFAAAIANGIPASHVIDDTPLILEQPDGSEWAPRNYGGDFRGPMTLREALRLSVNVVAVKLGLEVGVETVAQYARRFGVRTDVPRFPSSFIGAAEVIPIEVAEAYSPVATLGERVRPRAILRVEDGDGRLLWESRPERERVMDPLSSYVLLDMLRSVVDGGTAYSIRNPAVGNVPHELPIAGKTGTTNEAADVWFVGFTPDMLATVWFGFDRRQEIVRGAAGGVYSAPVFAEFVRSVYFGPDKLRDPPAEWYRPEELTTRQVDRETGKIATEWCPTELIYTELYVPGTEPTDACDRHGARLFGDPFGRGAPLRQPPPEPARDTVVPESTGPTFDTLPPPETIRPGLDTISPGRSPRR